MSRRYARCWHQVQSAAAAAGAVAAAVRVPVTIASEVAAARDGILDVMKVAHRRVVNGAVVTEAELPGGARVAILVHDDQPAFDLEPEDEAASRTR